MIDCIRIIGHIIHKKICGSSSQIMVIGPFAREAHGATQKVEKEREE
jgi:hypothetical protein